MIAGGVGTLNLIFREGANGDSIEIASPLTKGGTEGVLEAAVWMMVEVRSRLLLSTKRYSTLSIG